MVTVPPAKLSALPSVEFDRITSPATSNGDRVELRQLNLNSQLRDLQLYNFQVDSEQLGKEVARGLEANPLLPGVIITENDSFLGTISRRRFFENISRPYGLELFSQRPIKILYDFARSEVLNLPGATQIVMAAQRVVQRSPEFLDEPIVVRLAPQTYCLLDVHQLLIAQSQIHEEATVLLSKLYYDLEVANRELQRLAICDGLTKLANRRRFDEYLQQEWQRLARERSPLSLILGDIDFFKAYNDTYGHLTGDECLRQVASAIQEAVKRPADLVARYGGEEFAVILPNTDAEGAIAVAELIRQAVKALAIDHSKSLVSPHITISLGVATVIPSAELSPLDLIASADRGLYQAKSLGRDRYFQS
jgi:diguanylate cyclase (GGDEF)-like protein